MRRRKPKQKTLRCSKCRRDGHTALMCWYTPRQRLKVESDKTRQKRRSTVGQWYEQNRPDEYGLYTCYLQISPFCPRRIKKTKHEDQNGMQLEHVYPRNKYPELKFTTLNLKPACGHCNSLKLSNTIAKLANFFPRLQEMIQTPEWQAWEDQMEEIAHSLGITLDRPVLKSASQRQADLGRSSRQS